MTIIFRTFIVYLILILSVRLMGKRQIGELEVTDLVTTLLISEIASLPITNSDIPILHAAVPIALLLIIEVFSSVLLIRFPPIKPLLSAVPTPLIRNGVLSQKNLTSSRLTVEELMSAVRQQGYSDLSQISDAYLEKNGQLTLLPKPEFSPATVGDLGLPVKSSPLMHVLYYGKKMNASGLSLVGKDEAWLRRQVARRGYELKELFCILGNESGGLELIPKQGGKS